MLHRVHQLVSNCVRCSAVVSRGFFSENRAESEPTRRHVRYCSCHSWQEVDVLLRRGKARIKRAAVQKEQKIEVTWYNHNFIPLHVYNTRQSAWQLGDEIKGDLIFKFECHSLLWYDFYHLMQFTSTCHRDSPLHRHIPSLLSCVVTIIWNPANLQHSLLRVH